MSIRIGEQIISGVDSISQGTYNQNETSTSTSIYNWVGTSQEYEDQDIAEQHPEWVCYITDDEAHDSQEVEIIQYTARNVGDIFFTKREDTWLNGAVECDGSTYNVADYSGEDSIKSLLEDDKLPYVSVTDYDDEITAKGWCNKFGWDGIDAATFKVPTLTAKIIQENHLSVIGNGIALGLTDGTYENVLNMGSTGLLSTSGTTSATLPGQPTGSRDIAADNMIGITTDPENSGIITDITNDSATFRVMVQLSTGFNDESVETLHTLTAEITALDEAKQNKDTALNYDYISNCLLNIPQDIKLELNNNTITLKAGSKVYVPTDIDIFESVTTTADLSHTLTTPQTGLFFIVYNYTQNEIDFSWCDYTTSGTTPPVSEGLFYNTSTNQIRFYQSGSDTGDLFSLPFGIMRVQEGTSTIESITQVFNGFGYIGSTLFTLPGLKGLIANGRQDHSGKLKSINLLSTTVNVHTFDNSNNANNDSVWLASDGSLGGISSSIQYKKDLNKVIYTADNTERLYVNIGKATITDGVVKNLTTNTVFHAFNYNDLDLDYQSLVNHRVIDFSEPTAQNNYTWYRKYADGWVEQGGITSARSNNSSVTVTFPIQMADSNYSVNSTTVYASGGADIANQVTERTTTSVSIYDWTGRSTIWEVKGMAA